MSAQIIDGKKVSAEIWQELKQDLEKLKNQGRVPGLGVILVGDNPASQTYVGMKEKACTELGLYSLTRRLPAASSQQQLLDQVFAFNQDPAIHGILVQLPLPDHIDEEKVLEAVLPAKDVDGFHPVNRGYLVTGKDCFVPCTPAGIQEILLRTRNHPAGKHVVIVGRSNIVGLPLANLLIQKNPRANATVTICHSQTKNLGIYTQQADILVVAVGKAAVIDGSMIRPGAVVIDVGVNRVEAPEKKSGYRLVGDVDFDSAVKVAGAITPVPGGVGPMTITMLMKNTIAAATRLTHS